MTHPIHWLTLAAGLLLAFHPHGARADRSGGGGVGSGGGSWTCRANTDGHALVWAQLIDLFEARNEYGRDVPARYDFNGAIPTPSDFLASQDGYLILAESKIKLANPEFYAEYLRRKQQLRILMPTQAEFDLTRDIFRAEVHHLRPDASLCPGGTVAQDPEQLANFTDAGNLEINPMLWNSPALGEIDRAALFVHEIIYWIYRDFGHDQDSLRTRDIVGRLFSPSEPIDVYKSMLTLNPVPYNAPGMPLQYGMYAEPRGKFMDMKVTAYDLATRELKLEQRDRDDHWSVKQAMVFICDAHGSQFSCHMTYNSRTKPSDWNRTIDIIDQKHFVWRRLDRHGNAIRATTYSKLD